MADFQTSTQRAKWILTPQELVRRYKAANQRAIEALEKFGATLMEVDADGSLSYPDPQINSKDNADKHSRPKALSIEEEQFMRVFYENKLQEVCNNFHFPHKIQATALIYFKRFYLQWSVMQHHPKNVMLTCIYAACKIEENHVSAEELGKGISQDHQIILNYEMIVYQSLEFDLIVYAPYRSVEGFLDDMEELFHENAEMLQVLKETASSEVDKIMLTDAPLLFPPGQLALAALRRSIEVHGVIDFERYLESLLSRQNSAHTISELYEYLNSIDSWISRYTFPSEKDLKHINRKLKSCWGIGSNDEYFLQPRLYIINRISLCLAQYPFGLVAELLITFNYLTGVRKGRKNQSTNQRRAQMKSIICLCTINCNSSLALVSKSCRWNRYL